MPRHLRFALLALTALLSLAAASAPAKQPTDKPATPGERKWMTEKQWLERHEKLVNRSRQGNVDVMFLGDSITQGWPGPVWNKHFGSMNAANYGIGGDATQHVLWRLENGEAQNITPKVVVLLIGTNNFGNLNDNAADTARGVEAVVASLRHKFPAAKILLMGIFPRAEKPDHDFRRRIAQANARIAQLHDGNTVHYLDIGDKFLAPDGTLPKEIMPDFLHLSPKGYEIYAEAITPTLKKLLGE